MIRRLARGAGLVVLSLALASGPGAEAQTAVYLGGGAAVPSGDFASVADLGILGSAGGTAEVGTTGFAVGATGFFGSFPHSIAGERSDVYGLTVLMGYTIAEGYGVRFRGWAGLGGAVHARKSDSFPGLDASQRGVTVSAGGTVSRPLNRLRVFASALYTRGLGDLGTSAYPTQWVTLGVGVAIPLAVD